uniref:Transketolase n=1 Tax=Candidatus Kentrum sp. FM TaxID=2126340 RepID=A0A450SCS8_9GAMM|nr:MAG: transketolase [Candidatus Kentron sp. FM]VFJ52818.1 MAG: transketolase [Candidatus Kentron sp. FM]VFK09055.1 MAG: transketolase [Candidatus Kentron sp. FM]
MRKTCLNAVYELAKADERIVFIGSDLGSGVLASMKREIPERFFMEGVSEQHVIGMAAGLAMEGFIPYVNTIATFITRRCYEQVALDLCLQDLPVRLIGNGAGVVYGPQGPTHLAVEDLAILRALPNMTIVAPCDADEMRRFMEKTVDWPHPIYIRLARGGDPIVSREEHGFEIGKAIVLREPGRGLFVTTGVMTRLAMDATARLGEEGIGCGVLHMHTVKPLDDAALTYWIPRVEGVVTVEEHTRIGGLGSAILEWCNDEMPEQGAKIARIGFPDRFADQYGSQDSLLAHLGISVDSVCETMRGQLGG